ncbi:MAG: hypothetical protein HYU34_00335 [Candidatus Omnitrophica bacterium]|nr:hypothetical protein [Candidatus Omnitrophota bacterium]
MIQERSAAASRSSSPEGVPLGQVVVAVVVTDSPTFADPPPVTVTTGFGQVWH